MVKKIRSKYSLRKVHLILKETIFFSLGIKGIKNGDIFMGGWYCAIFFLTLGIGLLRRGIGFLSIYTFGLSVLLIVLLAFFGVMIGRNQCENELLDDEINNKKGEVSNYEKEIVSDF